MSKIWVSDVITEEEVKSWDENSIITIKAGTGVGKSHFIKNSLYNIANKNNKKILMLIHRKNCTDQFTKEIERDSKHDILRIQTYQSIEYLVKNGITSKLDMYDYIICDEWHYFMSDASFNKYTDISLKEILNTNSIKIFMSATDSLMKEFLTSSNILNYETIDYEVPTDFNFIKKLEFYNEPSTLDNYIRDILNANEKAVFFFYSAKDAFNMYEKYIKHSILNCGESNEHYKYVDKLMIDDMLLNEGFDKVNDEGKYDSTKGKSLLFTTSVMDAGVNLVMDNLKHIIINGIIDTGSLIQCIGRKRLQGEKDYINLYVKNIDNQRLGGLEIQAKNRLKLADDFIVYGQKQLVDNNYRDLYDDMIYDQSTGNGDEIRKKLNLLMYCKVKSEMHEIKVIKSYDSSNSYCDYLSNNVLGLSTYSVRENLEDLRSLEVYLHDLIGIRLYKEDQNLLINKIDLRVNGRQQRSYKKLNDGLAMIKVNFIITKNIDSRRKLDNGLDNPNRNKVYWEIVSSMT